MSTMYQFKKEQSKKLKKEMDEKAARLEFLLEKERCFKDDLLKSTDTYYDTCYGELQLEEITEEEKVEIKEILQFLFSYVKDKKTIAARFKKAQQREIMKYKQKIEGNKKYFEQVKIRRRHYLNVEFLNYYVELCKRQRKPHWLNREWFSKCKEAYTFYESYHKLHQKYCYHLEMINHTKMILITMLNNGKQKFPSVTFYETLFDQSLWEVCQSYDSLVLTQENMMAFVEDLYISLEEMEEELDILEKQWKHSIDENLYSLLCQYYLRNDKLANLETFELSNLKVVDLVGEMKEGIAKRLEENSIELAKCVNEEDISLLAVLIEKAQVDFLRIYKSKVSTYKEDEFIEAQRCQTILNELWQRAKKSAREFNFNFDPISTNNMDLYHQELREMDSKARGVFNNMLNSL